MMKTISRLFLITALVAMSFTWVKAGSFDLAFSASSGKSGDAFEIYSESLTSTNNVISYMTSSGNVLTTATINSWVKSDGRRYTTGVFPILIPGDYYIKVTNSNGLESNTAGFTLLSGGIYPKIEPNSSTATAGQQLKINTTNIVQPYKLTMYIGAYEVPCQPDYYACNATVPTDLVGKVYVSAYFNNYHVQSTQQVEIINPNLQQPVIDYILPTSGALGTTITVYGKYFNTGSVNSAWNGVSIEPVNNAGASTWNWQSLDVITNDSNKLSFTIGANNTNLAPGLYNISVTKKPVGGRSNYAQFNLTGSTGSMSFVSLNYGKDFAQGQDNFISWNGGKTRVMVGLVKTDYNPSDTNKNAPVGWITLVGSTNSSVAWNGRYLVDVNGGIAPEAISGKYRLILVSEGANGNFCTYDAINPQACNYALSDIFYLAPSSVPITKTTISYITPTSAKAGETVYMKIYGSGFLSVVNQSGNAVSSAPNQGLTLQSTKVVSDSEINATYSISANANPTTIQIGVGGSNTVPFTIVGGTTNYTVTVFSPAAGEQWAIGTKQTIKWTESQDIKKVAITIKNNVSTAGCETSQCVYNSGLKSYLLTQQGNPVSNSGSFAWTVGWGGDMATGDGNNIVSIPAGTYAVSVMGLDANGNSISGATGTSNWFSITSGLTPSPSGINLPDGTVLKLPGNPTVYLVVGGQLKPFTSAEDFLGKGYKWSDVQQVNPSQVSSTSGNSGSGIYPYPSGSLINDGGTIYFISGHSKVPFTNWQAFVGLGYLLKNVVEGDLTNYTLATNYFITTANAAHPWGSWVIYQGTVYYSSQNGLIGVPSVQVLNSNGGNWNLLVKANSYDVAALNANPNLSPLTLNDSRVYSASAQ